MDYQHIPGAIIGDTYKISITTTNATGSYLYVILGNSTTITGTINSSGTHEFEGILESTTYAVNLWSNDVFGGSVDDITLRRLVTQPETTTTAPTTTLRDDNIRTRSKTK